MNRNEHIRFSSSVAMSDEARSHLIQRSNRVLASLLDLASQVKQAHWNIKGPQFFARHQLFDDLAAHLKEWSDDVAERASTLGGYAKGTIRLAAEMSVLDEYDLEATEGRRHLMALRDRYGKLGGLLRETIGESARLEDPVSEDLYTEVLRGVELDMWFVESHLVD